MQKKEAAKSDPYDPQVDEELPKSFPKPENVDLVKTAFALVESIPDTSGAPFEMTVANLKLNVLRNGTLSTLSQTAYLGTFDPSNPLWDKTLIAYSDDDLKNSNSAHRVPYLEDKTKTLSLPQDARFGKGNFVAEIV